MNQLSFFIEAGDPRVREIGDGLSYKANLFDSNNNISGTKDITLVFTKELKNGDFIASVVETVHLPGGDIFLQGAINVNDFEALKTQKIDIIGGSGIYEGVKGKEYITQLNSDVFDVASISLAIH
ncbi:allene oxide cyclase barrel-like domain-containing protein [Nostoc sphaeroides]|uniref:allene oxide cyclase barrel-like domain-containing protein n=1 Tax=Nostoc sphaeroides TaxID=446679 RepID=UPI001269D0B9|nr:hypothetical protein [Nostoc sphaeroides]